MNSLLTAKSTIEEILQSHPQAKEVLASIHLTNCQKCAVRFDESLQEASDNYGFDLLSILQQLNNGLLKFEKSKRSSLLATYLRFKKMCITYVQYHK